MKQSTRTALKLAPGATDAEAAAAIDKGGHALTFADLDRQDADFLLFLKQQHPATYARLFKAQYGKDPVGMKAGAKDAPKDTQKLSAPEQQLLSEVLSNRSDKTIRDLEKEAPDVLLRLKHEHPAEYGRIYRQFYGAAPR